MIDEFRKTIIFLEERWYSKYTLYLGSFTIFIIFFDFIKNLFDGSPYIYINNNIWFIRLIFSIALVFLYIICWFYSRRYPKREDNKIGIVIAIPDNEKNIKKIKDEVIEQFRDILQETLSKDIIQIIPLKNFQAIDVKDIDSATKISNKTKAQFIIYGRLVNFNEQFEFNLHFLVRHKPLRDKTLIKKGFADALVDKNWSFLEKDTLNGVKFTAKNIREICLYVTGIAAHQSYDFEISKKLHTDLYNIFKNDKEKRTELSVVFKQLPKWLADANIGLALNTYYIKKDLNNAYLLNEEALKYDPLSDSAKLNKAFYSFQRGDILEAKRQIKSIRKQNIKNNVWDNSWRYSEGFLFFLDDKYEDGLRSYKKAFKKYISDFGTNGVIDFLINYIEQNPEKIQFKYVLASILINKKSNYSMAIDYLEDFIKKSDSDKKYTPLISHAKTYLLETYDIMNTPVKERINI